MCNIIFHCCRLWFYDLAFGNDDFSDAYPRLGLPTTYFIDAAGNVDDVVHGVVTFDSLEAWLES